MKSKRKLQQELEKKANQSCALVVILEKDEETKTIASVKWVDRENSIVWWPPGINVLNKINVEPDEETWIKYKLINVVLQGDENTCRQFLECPTTTVEEGSNSDDEEEPRKPIDFALELQLPKTPKTSMGTYLTSESDPLKEQKDRFRARSRESSSREPFKSYSARKDYHRYRSRSKEPPLPKSYSARKDHHRSRSRELPHKSYSARKDYHRSTSRSKQLFRSRSRELFRSTSRDHFRSRSRSSEKSVRSYTAKVDKSSLSAIKRSSGKLRSPRKDSAKLVKEKFPMDTAKFQRLVLTLLRHGCTCQTQPDDALEFSSMQNIDDFNLFEKRIDDAGEFWKMVKILKRVGGKNVKDNVKNVMDKLMSKEVMSLFNMKGKNRGEKKKNAFEKQRCCKVILETVKQNQQGSTEADIKEHIAYVLKFAPYGKKDTVEVEED